MSACRNGKNVNLPRVLLQNICRDLLFVATDSLLWQQQPFYLFCSPPQSIVETSPVGFFSTGVQIEQKLRLCNIRARSARPPSRWKHLSGEGKKMSKVKKTRCNVHILLCTKRVLCKEETNKDTGLDQTRLDEWGRGGCASENRQHVNELKKKIFCTEIYFYENTFVI